MKHVVYIDKLDDIVKHKYVSYHNQNVKHVDVNLITYVDFIAIKNDWDTTFEVGDHVRIPKYKNLCKKLFSKFPNWSEEVFVIKKVSVIDICFHLSGKKIVVTFYKRELQKTNQAESNHEKGDKLCVK